MVIFAHVQVTCVYCFIYLCADAGLLTGDAVIVLLAFGAFRYSTNHKHFTYVEVVNSNNT